MMEEMQGKLKKYIHAVRRRLNMPGDVKARVMNDFVSSVEGRREAGYTDAEIMAELGSPKKVAAELNEQMKDYTYIKSPWRWVCLIVIVGCVLSLLYGGLVGILTQLFNASVNNSIGIIGGADGPTAIFVTASPDYLWYQTGMTLVVLAMAVLGYFRLRRCPRK